MGLFAQIQAFLLTLILGVIVSFIFHYYQQTIRSMRVGRNILYVTDIILWMIIIVLIAAALLIINQVEIRVYVFIALLAGGFIYYKWLAQYMRQPLFILGRATAFMLKAVKAALNKPFILALNWLKNGLRRRHKPTADIFDDDMDDNNDDLIE